MAMTTSSNPQDDPARTQEDTRAPSAGRVEKFGGLDPTLFSPQPVPAEVEAPPDDKDLTDEAEECQNPVDMPAKEARPGQNDPALQEAFDAFDGANLPRPPLTKLTDLTPAEGLDVLRSLEEYLDRVGDPVANAVSLVLSDLRGKSFKTLEQTKELASRVQSILDRSGFMVECPNCSEPGRLDAAPRAAVPTGVYRVRHGSVTHGGSSTITDFKFTRCEKPSD
jgi:hypothetical protein